ncbi:MAG: DUF711 family protein, partial [Chloroflexi bacterium]|nr:DUF711 family protein [Chloroflexota bacterium]
MARGIEDAATAAGIEYVSLGPASAEAGIIVDVISSTSQTFLNLPVTPAGEVDLPAVEAAAQAVFRIAQETEAGFGNLRFAATAGCGPNIPFFPAAYHDGGHPKFSLALQAADLVCAAFEDAGSLTAAAERLAEKLLEADRMLTAPAKQLEREFAIEYLGADFSPAPFPDEQTSIAGAFQRLGLERFGAAGTVYAAALLTRALKTSPIKHWGFNGLMLPVLEDLKLAAGSRSGDFTVNDLLLYSAVCGTGLDTVPLPGDTSEDELAGIILDMGALSVALNGKPLTARLLPVPGKQAGDLTEFDFEYFANGAVLATKGISAGALFGRGR